MAFNIATPCHFLREGGSAPRFVYTLLLGEEQEKNGLGLPSLMIVDD